MNKKPNLLYLHGYQGYVTEEKKAFLKQISNAFYPQIDYDLEANTLFDKLLNLVEEHDIQLISGTSLGAVISYLIGMQKSLPMLLFNPAVSAIEQLSTFIPFEYDNLQIVKPAMVVVGEQDEIIPASTQVSFFESMEHVSLYQWSEMTHFVTLSQFEKAFRLFYEMLENQPI
ncbi:YqiA/YcfP family alpha/beta fold hydrolase [Vaginella massiliensis]|uniref:YqiA/YcfP family alpha/beta fold hydrolase n=1 Tax=Vaginella massiliensis TaxID=1816680 RepID=UPI000837EB42|nr:YqiA/YcfP family alpha/beta fold hydrolase [Vaginella massiliensis]